MEEFSNYLHVIDKLRNGEQFGLFEDGTKCYFQDGTKVSYTELWIALKIVHNLPPGIHHKTLIELCPNSFIGTFPYRFSMHKWEKITSEK